jgi:hypothetical protein
MSNNMNNEDNENYEPRVTTSVKIVTSDNILVNDLPEPKNKFNCYLATAGGLLNKNVSELNVEVSDIICERGGETLENICKIYDNLGFKNYVLFDDPIKLKVYIKNNIERGERKKYALACFYEGIGGHVIALKVNVKENNHYSYVAIDYQMEDKMTRTYKQELPPLAKPPFYLFELKAI